VDGLVVLAVESDDAGWDPALEDGARDMLIERAECLDLTLRSNVETLTQWSVENFLNALMAVSEDLESECPRGGLTLDGPGRLGERVKYAFGKLIKLFVNPDDPMGTAFIVRLGVTSAYFNDNLATLIGAGREDECDDGSKETVVAGCTPFLVNPCEMKMDSDAISTYASFCASQALTGVRYPGQLDVRFERAGRGMWTVRFDL
jgi:hypothetical protein